MKQIMIEPTKEINVSTSDNMNILMGSTIQYLASIHPDHPASLRRDDISFCTNGSALMKYRDDVIGYYNEHGFSDTRVTKTLIMLHYLDTLAKMAHDKNGFEKIFAEDSGAPFLAALFYRDISINHRAKMIPTPVTPSEFADYLKEVTEKHIPIANRSHGEFDFLNPTGVIPFPTILPVDIETPASPE